MRVSMASAARFNKESTSAFLYPPNKERRKDGCNSSLGLITWSSPKISASSLFIRMVDDTPASVSVIDYFPSSLERLAAASIALATILSKPDSIRHFKAASVVPPFDVTRARNCCADSSDRLSSNPDPNKV